MEKIIFRLSDGSTVSEWYKSGDVDALLADVRRLMEYTIETPPEMFVFYQATLPTQCSYTVKIPIATSSEHWERTATSLMEERKEVKVALQEVNGEKD